MIMNDPVTGLRVIIKHPWESLLLDMQFKNRMRDGDTISSVDSVNFINQNLLNGSSDIVLAGPAFDGTVAQVRVSAGQDLENYKLSFRCTTALGDKIEADGMLYVRD